MRLHKLLSSIIHTQDIEDGLGWSGNEPKAFRKEKLSNDTLNHAV